ncbi:MAG: phosphodiesterase [Gammaproteobacteria bacterium]|nr:phosphodiesterase [Gammaproteobacteria bacterium]
MKFIHLTDTHLVAHGERLHGIDACARLEACAESITEAHADAAFCVLTGDVADAGDPRAYDAARTLLAHLPMPVHLIPGNHDDRDEMIAAFPDIPRDADGFVQQAFRHGDAHFVLLDTLEPSEGSGGAVCERRAAWLEQRLAAAGDAPVYLFMHHPPFAIGIPALDRIALADPAPFTRVVAAAGNVRHIFFGHAHRPISGQWRGIGYSTLYGTNHQTRLDLVSSAPIAYTAEPPAYCVVLADEEKVVVHTCYFLEDDRDIRQSR